MSAFAAVLVLLGMVLLVAAAIYAAARLLGVAKSPSPVPPLTGGLPPAEHAFSRFHVRWYALAMLFLAFDMEMIFIYPWTLVISAVGPLLAAYLSAHRTMINGSALCAALAVTERD